MISNSPNIFLIMQMILSVVVSTPYSLLLGPIVTVGSLNRNSELVTPV